MTARRRQPESQLQRSVFAHIRARGAPGLFAFHCPNGGYRRPREAAIMKGLGVRPGVPDVILIHKGRVFGLELKIENGRSTDIQLAAHEAMEQAGADVYVAKGLDSALKKLEDWGLLMGRAM